MIMNLTNGTCIILCMDKLKKLFLSKHGLLFFKCKTASVIGMDKGQQVGDHLINLSV